MEINFNLFQNFLTGLATCTTQLNMSNICKKLVKSEIWQDKKSRPNKELPGIYAIGKVRKQHKKTIYVGRSKNIRIRLNQHFQRSSRKRQRINEFVQDPENEIVVKWVIDKKQKQKEGEYLHCNTKLLGYKPEFNMRRGDSAKKMK